MPLFATIARLRPRRAALGLVLCASVLSCEWWEAERALDAPARVLVFSRTTGFRHASIATGIEALRTLGAARGFDVEATEDPATFAAATLARFDVVLFLNTTGDVLDAAQQSAFEAFIRAGGGFVGVHSAADTEYGWPWYGALMGAYFKSHPAIQQATLSVVDAAHPSTAALPPAIVRTDEWYDFRSRPAPPITVLITIDEASYAGGTMGTPHPIAWYHTFDGGRAWYTAMGHTAGTYSEPLFLEHLAGGIRWAAGRP